MLTSKAFCINYMAECGYLYDWQASTDDYIKFNYPGMVFPMVFNSWDEVEQWIKEVD